MAGLIPIPTTRITGLYSRQRLTQQLQADQLDLFRIQDQISTGQKIILPSDDAPAALRSISLQRLLERKSQIQSSVSTGMEYLAATDATLNSAADLLFDVRAETLGVVGTVTTAEQREAAISRIDSTLEQLLTTANTQYRGRHLFSGTQTSLLPYELTDEGVVYHGDDGVVQTFSNLNVLFDTNVSGQDVFGGFSAAVEGTTDLTPQLSDNTLLSSLRGGQGIEPNGAFTISDGFDPRTIDLRGAVTVGDVKRLIEENVPTGREITVSISGTGINLQFDPAYAGNTGANLIVGEVGTGRTAAELGIVTESGVGTSQSVGDDLDPILRETSRLESLLGTKARALLTSGGENNDILLEASANGVDSDGVVIQVVDDATVTAGSEIVDYDSVAKTLTLRIDGVDSKANDVINAINAEGTFSAELDLQDSSSLKDAGSGAVSTSATATTTGGSGASLDLASGLRIVNGGKSHEISFEGAETVNDLLNILNGSGASVLAEINDLGTGINIRSRLSGGDFQIGENGGNTAEQLGIRSYHSGTKLSDLNAGTSVPTFGGFDLPTTSGDDLIIDTIDGQSFQVDLSGAESVADVVDAINAVTGASVTALEVVTGNVSELQLVDNSVTGSESFTITQATGSLAAQYLGIIPNNIDTQVVSGGATLQGSDANYIDFTITATDGSTYSVDVSAAETVGQTVDAINNALAGSGVSARLGRYGNGIELVDTTGGTGDLSVSSVEGSDAAQALGLESGKLGTSGSGTLLTGEDRQFLETESVFTTLIRLRDALEVNDAEAVSRAAGKLDVDLDRLTFARSAVGAEQQALEISQQSLQDEDIQLRSALSEELDVDLVQAISDLTSRQIALQASLQATANLLQLSLLNFI